MRTSKITLHRLKSDIVYRTMSVDELAKVIGNDVSPDVYMKMDGEDSTDKAKKLIESWFNIKLKS